MPASGRVLPHSADHVPSALRVAPQKSYSHAVLASMIVRWWSESASGCAFAGIGTPASECAAAQLTVSGTVIFGVDAFA